MRIKTFSRRIGKGLPTIQKALLSDLLPTLLITPGFNFEELKKKYHQINLEIGFGNGDFLFNKAISFPHQMFIGCEPYLNGVAKLLNRMKDACLSNVLLFTDDARLLLEAAPDNYFNAIHIICPDPWPKRKQHKRRLLNANMFKGLAQKLAYKDGVIEIITDHKQYGTWILKEAQESKVLNVTMHDIEDHVVNDSKDWFHTKYQLKGLEKGHSIYYFKWHSNTNL